LGFRWIRESAKEHRGMRDRIKFGHWLSEARRVSIRPTIREVDTLPKQHELILVKVGHELVSAVLCKMAGGLLEEIKLVRLLKLSPGFKSSKTIPALYCLQPCQRFHLLKREVSRAWKMKTCQKTAIVFKYTGGQISKFSRPLSLMPITALPLNQSGKLIFRRMS
jgi:hypothetical protein